MIKVTVLLALVLLSGCQPNSLNKAQQDYMCSEKGGVYKYGLMFGQNTTKPKCNNGEHVNVPYNQQIPPEFYPKKD